MIIVFLIIIALWVGVTLPMGIRIIDLQKQNEKLNEQAKHYYKLANAYHKELNAGEGGDSS